MDYESRVQLQELISAATKPPRDAAEEGAAELSLDEGVMKEIKRSVRQGDEHVRTAHELLQTQLEARREPERGAH